MARKRVGRRRRFEIPEEARFTCEPCRTQPPDAVLTSDHIAPIATGGTNQEVLVVKEVTGGALACRLQMLWRDHGDWSWAPSETAIRPRIDRYGLEGAGDALSDAATKDGGGYISSYGDHSVNDLHAVARNMAAEAELEAE